MTRALLVLIGGRQVPNLLSAQYLRPDRIVPVASHEALRPGDVWAHIEPVLRQLCPEGLQAPIVVDAFDLEAIRQGCSAAFDAWPEAEWVANVTCATTVMSIGAYEAARARGHAVWYLNSARRQVVSLHGAPVASEQVYRLDIANYLSIYGRSLGKKLIQEPTLEACAAVLAQHPQATVAFREQLRAAGADKKSPAASLVLPALSAEIQLIAEALHTAGLFSLTWPQAGGPPRAETVSKRLWGFINGGWLEVYAGMAAREADCDDVCSGLEIPGVTGANNELDLVATYGGTLIIGECKTDHKPFKTSYLDKLGSVGALLGGDFVTRIFICSQIVDLSDQSASAAFKAFKRQAAERRIVVVTGDALTSLAQQLRTEAGNQPGAVPSYFLR